MGKIDVNWDQVLPEAVEHLQNLLRLNTTNPPGNEIIATKYIEEVLGKEGIESTTVESAPTRANLFARLEGANREDGLLLSSHVDVVTAEPEHWTQDPFGGTIHDGWIFGRGAVDMKNMTTLSLISMIIARRHNVKLRRDLVMGAFADEEAGCNYGSRFIVEQRPDLLKGVRWALNEVGGFNVHVEGSRLYPIQVAEKGFVWMRMKAKGEPGHGSMPHADNAVVKLGKALAKLQKGLPVHITPVQRQFMEKIAELAGGTKARVMRAALNPMMTNSVLKLIGAQDKERAKVLAAGTHNTVCPTGLKAGSKENVIPSEAEAVLDCRILPGTTVESLIDEIRKVVGEGFEFEIINSELASLQDYDTDLYRCIEHVVKEADPEGHVAPYLVIGFTDASALKKAGITTYGYTPQQLPEDLQFTELFHGHDERIGVESFKWGVKAFWRVIEEFCID